MTAPRFTPLDAHDVARIVHRRRPQWDEPGIVAALGRLAYDLDVDQALAAALSAAADPEARGPGAIAWERHRTKALAPAGGPNPQRGARSCPDHGTYRTEQCHPCRSEHIAPDEHGRRRPMHLIGRHWDTEDT